MNSILKYSFGLSLGVILLTAIVFAGDVRFSPEKPTAGAKVSLKYTPAGDMTGVSDFTAYVYIWHRAMEPTLVEVPLEKKGDAWISRQDVPVDTAVYLCCKIVAPEGEDTNDNRLWGVPVYGGDGKPVQGALLAQVQAVGLTKNPFKESSAREEALRLLGEETRNYPSSPVWSIRWQLLFAQLSREQAMSRVETEIDSLVSVSASESDLLDCATWYERIGEPAKADTLLDRLIDRFKSQSASVRKEIKPLRQLGDMELIKTALANMIATYPDAPESESLKSSMVQIALQQKKWEEAATAVEQYNITNPDICTLVARQILEQDGPPATAVRMTQRAVQSAQGQTKPPTVASREWKPVYENALSEALSLHGIALAKDRKYAEAEPVLADAIARRSQPDAAVMQTFIISLTQNGKKKETLPVYEQLAVAGFLTDQLREEFRAVYTAVHGNDKDFDAKLKGLTEKAVTAKFDALKRATIKQSIKDFTLPSLAGETVSLGQLRGKVVVLDFWATWCGPCKQSFPHLQKVYDRFKSSDDVVIYAVNTFERISGDARRQAVEKFIRDNKYGFPVLLDADVASSNGIQSIPTQFIIDKNGLIRFINVGFEGPQMTEELSAKIELLRIKEFYQ